MSGKLKKKHEILERDFLIFFRTDLRPLSKTLEVGVISSVQHTRISD